MNISNFNKISNTLLLLLEISIIMFVNVNYYIYHYYMYHVISIQTILIYLLHRIYCSLKFNIIIKN